MAVGVGRTTAPADDSGPAQTVQVRLSGGEVRDGLPVTAIYGLASHAPVGSDVVCLFLGGDRSNGVVIGTANQGSRPRGRRPGEVAIYNEFGMTVFLSADGIRIDAGGKPLRITRAPEVTMDGDLKVKGEVTAMSDGAAIRLSQHKHGGVRSGAELTASPGPG